MKEMSKKGIIIMCVLFILWGIVSRLTPHLWNTTPITAIALFSSAYLGFRYSSIILFLIMIVSDAFIGFYEWHVMLSVYISFSIALLLGLYVKKNRNINRVFVSSLTSSILFFLITNWAVWQFGSMYTHSFSGLMDSYIMALPFFRNSLFGDLLYSGLLLGVFEFVKRYRFVQYTPPHISTELNPRNLFRCKSKNSCIGIISK